MPALTGWHEVWLLVNPVKKVRKRRGLSQLKLSEKAGLDDKTVRDCETGRIQTNTRSLSKLSIALRVPFHVLIQVYYAWWELRPGDESVSRRSLKALERFVSVEDSETGEWVFPRRPRGQSWLPPRDRLQLGAGEGGDQEEVEDGEEDS